MAAADRIDLSGKMLARGSSKFREVVQQDTIPDDAAGVVDTALKVEGDAAHRHCSCVQALLLPGSATRRRGLVAGYSERFDGDDPIDVSCVPDRQSSARKKPCWLATGEALR